MSTAARQWLFLTVAAVVAIGYEALSPVTPSTRNRAAAITEKGRGDTVSTRPDHDAFAVSHRMTADVAGPDTAGLPVESWTDRLRVDTGEPLDADGGGEPGLSESQPMDTGFPLGADDPLTGSLGESSGVSLSIGEPLDADDSPTWILVATDGPIQVGPDLNADDPAY